MDGRDSTSAEYSRIFLVVIADQRILTSNKRSYILLYPPYFGTPTFMLGRGGHIFRNNNVCGHEDLQSTASFLLKEGKILWHFYS